MGLNLSDDFLEKFGQTLQSNQITLGAKGHRVVDTLEDVFARTWILCRHLILILECFVNFGYIKQTKYFGTYRVDLVVALFARVVDIHNFDHVVISIPRSSHAVLSIVLISLCSLCVDCQLNCLSPLEAAAVICRLGWLNLYNPCKPEGSWELDLSRREERIIAKTLCVLATHEPGDNWTYNTFRWQRDMESMPGWELVSDYLLLFLLHVVHPGLMDRLVIVRENRRSLG